ncbi:TonB-linked SusC/RagA family outer membrane protein [Filimonas zeae]|uniref:SusC/RagA family TonB-linked outer membrane protein n=1 Tax=Filimonas zeae TaxID=1737353 RepID=A0A917IUV6_9BACT|nr:SusC/RagA family TonB-linked outer membrane protein [Filimonas zeae]MDR6339283.1 TonB-linked SusC/RagA family outer membrane protein [Filimonas zeae]GGH64301.1 SusC/RagA family TonB-linked outer membrane protein [Filimonas zeae]
MYVCFDLKASPEKKCKPKFRKKLLVLLFCLGYGANAVMAQIHYSGKEVKLDKVFAAVKQQTGYSIMYNPDMVEKAKPVTIEAHDMSVEAFLTQVLKGSGLAYTIENKTVFIKKAEAHDHAAHMNTGGLKLTRIYQLEGTITNAKGEPLPAVTVAVNGTTKGMATDDKGHFALEDVPENGTLRIASVGYETILVPVKSCAANGSPAGGITCAMPDHSHVQITIVMKAAVNEMTDLFLTANTGYQTLSKERITGAADVITDKELNAHLNTSLSAAIEGKVAGLSMYKNNPVIRGVGTFRIPADGSSASTPLLVIDGVVTEGTLDQINPYDIESVTVLKDAAAASIYGARAANGVIVLSTRTAKRGETQLSVNADYFITDRPDLSKMHYASTSDMIDYETQVYKYNLSRYANNTTSLFNSYGTLNNATTYYSPLYALYRNEAENKITAKQVDSTLSQWRNNDYMAQFHDLVWRPEVRKRLNMSIGASSDKSNTYFSLNYDGNQLRMKNNYNDNFNLYFKNSYNYRNWFQFTVGGNAGYTRSVTTPTEYDNYFLQPRYDRIVDDAGNRVNTDYINLADGFSSNVYMNSATVAAMQANGNFKPVYFNILDELEYNKTKKQSLRLRAFADATAKLLPFLNFSTRFQYELAKNETEFYSEAASYKMRYLYNTMTSYDAATKVYKRNVPDGDRLYQLMQQGRNFTWRNQFDFNKRFTAARAQHEVTAIAGMEVRETFSPVDVSSLRYGFNPVTLGNANTDWLTLSETGINSYVSGKGATLSYTPGKQLAETRHRFVSYYGNMGYTLNGKYNLTGSVRVDVADFFGGDPKYRYRPLWSVGGGWNINREDFMKGIHWVNMLKMRATYGVSGSVDQSSSPYVTATIRNDNLFNNLQYYNITSYPNPKLRWEKSATVNLGLDFALFNHVVTGSLDMYRKYSSDLFVIKSLDPTVGTTSQTINNGAISNKGIELAVNYNWLRKKDFQASSAVTFAYNTNRIVNTERLSTTPGVYISSPAYYFMAGTPLNSVYAYRYGGMVKGVPYVLDEKGAANVTYDADGNLVSHKVINSVDALVRMGTVAPVWSGSFRQSFAYKGFQISAMFAFYGGHKMRRDATDFSGYLQTDKDIANRWTTANPNSDIPRFQVDYAEAVRNSANDLSSYYRYSDLNVVSATSVRMRNLSLAYALPAKYSRLIGMKGVRLTAQANNLWLWSAAGDDLDPETMSLNSPTRTLPTSRSFLFGLNVNF